MTLQTPGGTTPAGTPPNPADAMGIQAGASGYPLTAAMLNANWHDLQEAWSRSGLAGVVTGGVVTATLLALTIPSGTVYFARQIWPFTSDTVVNVTDASSFWIWGCSDGVIRTTDSSAAPDGFDARSACLLAAGASVGGTATLTADVQHAARAADGAARTVQDGPMLLDYGAGIVDMSGAAAVKVPAFTSDPDVPGTGVYLWFRTDKQTLRLSVSGTVTEMQTGLSLAPMATAASGAALTVDWAEALNQTVTLTANCTFTFDAPAPGRQLTLALVQDATGSRTVTWPASVKWGGSAPTLSTTPGDKNVLEFYYDGVDYASVGVGGAAGGMTLGPV